MKNNISSDVFDTDDMAIHFYGQFTEQAFTVGQQLAFKYQDKKLLQLIVKEIQVVDVASIKSDSGKDSVRKVKTGLLSANSTLIFVEGPDAGIKLKGKFKSGTAQQSLINPNWDFESLGIGGLDNELKDIFRLAFASKVTPLESVEQLELTHVKGILLYGPPGTGKTLIARQIVSMLNPRPVKVVEGNWIFNDSNVENLFAEAEVEFAQAGNRSVRHIIIFDDIDAICKRKYYSVVNQLLSKIDSLNNILVIGMTNRKDLIDEALLRPGRFELQIEIGLPDEKGREQILKIHTKKIRENRRLADDVDLQELSAKAKYFSGAELEGLVRAANVQAMARVIRPENEGGIDAEELNKLTVCRRDFLRALKYDIKPAFGASL